MPPVFIVSYKKATLKNNLICIKKRSKLDIYPQLSQIIRSQNHKSHLANNIPNQYSQPVTREDAENRFSKLQGRQSRRQSCMERMAEDVEDPSTSKDDKVLSPHFNAFSKLYNGREIEEMTTFTIDEFIEIFAIVEPIFVSNWNTG